MQKLASSLTKAAKSRTAAVTAATAGAAAVQSPAHASYHPHQVARRDVAHPSSKIQDDWELADFERDFGVSFRADEVDQATHDLTTFLASSSSSVYHDVESDTSDSDGFEANAILAMADPRVYRQGPGALTALGQEAAVVSLANRLLKAPGVQREILWAMATDPDIRAVLQRESDNLDEYLQSRGIAARGLIGTSEGIVEEPASDNDSAAELAVPAAELLQPLQPPPQQQREGKRVGLRERIATRIADAFDAAGKGLGEIGAWVRLQFAGVGHALQQHDQQQQAEDTAAGCEQAGAEAEVLAEDVEGVAAGAQAGSSSEAQRPVDQLIGAAVVVAAAIVSLLVLRRPIVLARVVRVVAARS